MKKLTALISVLALLITLVSCAAEPVKAITLDDIHKTVEDALEDRFFSDEGVQEAAFISMFSIDKTNFEDFFAEGFGFDPKLDTLVAVKAAEGKADLVEKALLDWRTYQIEEVFQYPLTAAKIKGSEVIKHGSYVILVMLGPATIDDEADETAQIEAVKAENKLAIEALEKLFA